GTSAEETLLYAERAENLVRKLPHVNHVLITVGEDAQKTKNFAQLYVDLVDPGERKLSQFELMDQARQVILPEMPESLRVNIAEVPDIAIGGETQGVQYIITGPDFDVLEKSATAILGSLKKSGK